MQLEDFLDFEPPPLERIRVRGTRINLEHIVSLFKGGMTPEQIHAYFGQWPPLEKVYGTIAYYLNNKESVESYMARIEATFQEQYQAYQKQPESELMRRIRELKEQGALAQGPAS
ncbi:MAG: DUF433 domain-containing protein [Planctomycetes bacterium]|nr:DUF433 domain-containing protein [Planctomycetota bacterium]